MIMMEPNSTLGQYSELVAAILDDVVSHGLQRRIMSVTAIRQRLDHLTAHPSDFETMFADTMVWLRDEGYIRFSTHKTGRLEESYFQDVVPTAKCLAAMDKKIEGLEKTARQVLAANTAGEASATNYVKAGSFFGGFFGGAIRSLG
jgi:hypothetical protein